MGERIVIIHGKVNYEAAYQVLEAHREELVTACGGENNAEATLDAICDLAAEQSEDEDD